MQRPKSKPTINLKETAGSPFKILAKVKAALSEAGADLEYIKVYLGKATSKDYDHLLLVTREFVNVKWEEGNDDKGKSKKDEG